VSERAHALRLERLIRAGALDPGIAVTVRGRSDGAGSQAAAVVSGQVFARAMGCRYLHSPFAVMSHDDGSPPAWAARWETFLNLGAGEAPLLDGADVVDLADVVAGPDAYRGRAIVIQSRRFALAHGERAATERLRPALRARYLASSKVHLGLHRGSPGGITVAVHVRRGDVTASRHPGRYVPDGAFLRAIEVVRAVAGPTGRRLRINVYSEGPPEMFSAFAAAGCHLYLDTDPFEVFHNLVMADILMALAPSAFSAVAAILSSGVRLGDSGRRDPLRRGIPVFRDGALPPARLRRALLADVGWGGRIGYALRRGWRALAPRRA
jgi:hypothetical protein